MNKNFDELRVPYGLAVHDEEEENAVLEIIKNKKTIMVEKVKQFEKNISKIFSKKFSTMVNSGSSANLLAFEALDFPKNSEIITPILTFATTLSPIIKKELIPVFVDVEPETFIVNIDQIEESITDNTKALMIPSLLGNIPDMERLRKIADDNDLVFIEDSADTLGATFDDLSTGKFSDISTTSFYGSHIITAAGEGGMICCNDQKMDEKFKILRGWGRSSALNESEEIEKRFNIKLDNIPYDSKFIFEEIGYNFLPTEISAAFGLIQLKKLEKFAEIRQKNFDSLYSFFMNQNFFRLPKQLSQVKTSWLAFPLTIENDAPFSRIEIVKYLESHGIQTRPVFTGNVLRQPAFKKINYKNSDRKFDVTNNIMKNSFLIGCNHGLNNEHIEKIKSVFQLFLDKF
ncbi:MAG: NarL family transcriptional regulator [Candidatus Marinimicrobia bacterium]|nr:NarL family transcriptional regulator [Candidatus Neomarinimicrobiota bacterium]